MTFRHLSLFLTALVPAVGLLAATQDAGAADMAPPASKYCLVMPPPSNLGVDEFYKKYCSTMGIPILSSERVPDAALRKAAEIVSHMLVVMPEVRKQLVRAKIQVAVIAQDEQTTDIPEYRSLKGDPKFATVRGLGATADIRVASGAEENLLCYPSDAYAGENIFVHEFGHTIKEMGLEAVDQEFRGKVQRAYRSARQARLWENTYSMNNGMTDDPVKYAEEYWAEGVESYFDANRFADPPDGIHNAINTRAKLRIYDRPLYKLINDAFRGTPWRPRCP
jgi:hypothetical protein